jgi:hypothetical protein
LPDVVIEFLVFVVFIELSSEISTSFLLTWRLNSQLRHAGLDPASSLFLDSRPLPAKGQARGNDNLLVFIRRGNNTSLFQQPSEPPTLRPYSLSLQP